MREHDLIDLLSGRVVTLRTGEFDVEVAIILEDIGLARLHAAVQTGLRTALDDDNHDWKFNEPDDYQCTKCEHWLSDPGIHFRQKCPGKP